MTEKVPVIQIYDGSWYALSTFSRDICCGCGLVHDTEFKLENGKIMFRATVNQRETRKHRRKHGLKVVKETK